MWLAGGPGPGAAANSKSSPVLPTPGPGPDLNSSHVASLSGIKLELLSNLLVVLSDSDIIVRVEMIDSNFTQLSRSHGIDLAWITSLPRSRVTEAVSAPSESGAPA